MLKLDLFSQSEAAQEQKKIDALFPKGIEANFEQGNSGNCYALAALDALAHHPYGRWAILDLFVQSPDGPEGWDVYFPGEVSAEGITMQDLLDLKNENKALKQAPLGYLLIERAHARHSNRVETPGFIGPTVRPGRLAFEGGFPCDAMLLLCGDSIQVRSVRIRDMADLLEIFREPNGNKVFNVFFLISEDLIDTDGKSRRLIRDHAYSVRQVDLLGRKIFLANPHDTKGDSFWLTFDQIVTLFPSFSIGQLNMDLFNDRGVFPTPSQRLPEGIAAAMLLIHEAVRLLPEAVPVPPEDVSLNEPLEMPSSYQYSRTGDVMRRVLFRGDSSTGQVQNRFVALYEHVNSAPPNKFFYFDALGNLLDEVDLPLNFNKEGEKNLDRVAYEVKLQSWHNENRRRLLGKDAVCPADFNSLGYPFVASSKFAPMSGSDQERDQAYEDKNSTLDSIMGRLDESIHSGSTRPQYFNGQPIKFFDAISKIAETYDVPVAIALGIGANESAYDKENDISSADARGAFQLKDAAFRDAKKWAVQHPELGEKVRSGAIGNFEDSWSNRFISTELFCAYYRYLSEKLRGPIEVFENRMRSMDPSFPVGALREIGVINAYNAGEGTIGNAIERFLALDDEALHKLLGEPPYGVDVWLAMLAHSFGLSVNGKRTSVGLHVFTYPQKVLAMGALIRNEENYLNVHDRDRSETLTTVAGDEFAETVEPLKAPIFLGTGLLSSLAGVWAALSGVSGTVRKDGHLTRRDLLKLAVAAAAVGVPGFEAAPDFPSEGINLSPESSPVLTEGENLIVTQQAKSRLDQHYINLAKLVRDEGRTGWTTREQNAAREALIGNQRILLEEEFRAMMGNKLFDKFQASKKLKTGDRADLYKEVASAQKLYFEQERAMGNLVPIPEDDPSAPYFPEQVGKLAGTSNNPDSLFMHKDFEWIMPIVIELVNHQIDAFNLNPSIYGITDPRFPALPHVSAVKISGAYREVLQTKAMLQGGQAGRTTKDVSAHWLGLALDIASFATQGGHMVRLQDDFYDSKEGGELKIKEGDLLGNQGFGVRAREIYSMMFGRALFSLIDPLRNEKGIILAPLWEPGQLNWHVVIRPAKN